ncbi:hypothetical protein BDZ94DRAFT_1257403, partial [Collybia nuda]
MGNWYLQFPTAITLLYLFVTSLVHDTQKTGVKAQQTIQPPESGDENTPKPPPRMSRL